MLRHAQSTVDFNEAYPIGITPQTLTNVNYSAADMLDGVYSALFLRNAASPFPHDEEKAAACWAWESYQLLSGVIQTTCFIMQVTAQFLDDLTCSEIRFTPAPSPPAPAQPQQ